MPEGRRRRAGDHSGAPSRRRSPGRSVWSRAQMAGSETTGTRGRVAEPDRPPLVIGKDRAAQRTWCDFVLGAAYEGPPGHVHGGVVARPRPGARHAARRHWQARFHRLPHDDIPAARPLGPLHAEAWVGVGRRAQGPGPRPAPTLPGRRRPTPRAIRDPGMGRGRAASAGRRRRRLRPADLTLSARRADGTQVSSDRAMTSRWIWLVPS